MSLAPSPRTATVLLVATVAALTAPRAAGAWCRTRTLLPALCYDERGAVRDGCEAELQGLLDESTELCGADEAAAGAPTCAARGTPIRWDRACVGFAFYGDGPPEAPDIESLAPTFATAAARWHDPANCASDGGTAAAWLRVERLCEPDGGPCPASDAPHGYDRAGPNANTVSFDRAWGRDAMHSPDTIAVTSVIFDPVNGQILDADMTLNARDFAFAEPAPGDGRRRADLAWVVTHEFGHFIGLAHSTCRRAVMWYTAGLAASGEVRLTADDSAALCAAYDPGALPANAACSFVPYGGFALPRNGARVAGGCRAAPVGGAARSAWRGAPAAVLALLALGAARRARARAR